METAALKLTQLGFSKYEAKAYITLAKENPLTAYELAKNSGIPTSKIYEVIKKLEKRQTIQAIHGERSKVYVPAPADEFIHNYRTAMEDNLNTIKDELSHVKKGTDISYTWHINNHENLFLKAKRMIETAETSIILHTWPPEMSLLLPSLQNAEKNNVKIAVIHYGQAHLDLRQVYTHPTESTTHEKRETRGIILVTDSKQALNGTVTDKTAQAIWSMNEGFVLMAESYIRHDIYQMKIMKRFDPVLRKAFGERYEKMLDVYSDSY